MAKKKPTKRTRLVRGKHFCGWKWEHPKLGICQGTDHQHKKPKKGLVGYSYGNSEWVRVRYAKA